MIRMIKIKFNSYDMKFKALGFFGLLITTRKAMRNAEITLHVSTEDD